MSPPLLSPNNSPTTHVIEVANFEHVHLSPPPNRSSLIVDMEDHQLEYQAIAYSFGPDELRDCIVHYLNKISESIYSTFKCLKDYCEYANNPYLTSSRRDATKSSPFMLAFIPWTSQKTSGPSPQQKSSGPAANHRCIPEREIARLVQTHSPMASCGNRSTGNRQERGFPRASRVYKALVASPTRLPWGVRCFGPSQRSRK